MKYLTLILALFIFVGCNVNSPEVTVDTATVSAEGEFTVRYTSPDNVEEGATFSVIEDTFTEPTVINISPSGFVIVRSEDGKRVNVVIGSDGTEVIRDFGLGSVRVTY